MYVVLADIDAYARSIGVDFVQRDKSDEVKFGSHFEGTRTVLDRSRAIQPGTER